MSSISFDNLVKVIAVVAVVLFFMAVAFVSSATKIVPENKRVIVMRLGKILGSRGPGIVTIIPIIDLAIWVDLDQSFHFEHNNLSTADDRNMFCSIILEGRITDPEKSVLNVPNLELALSKVIATELIDIARTRTGQELIQRTRWLEDQLKDVLMRASRGWGFEVLNLGINDIQYA